MRAVASSSALGRMRRPSATTVSPASTCARRRRPRPAPSRAPCAAHSRAAVRPCAGVSSMSAATTRVGLDAEPARAVRAGAGWPRRGSGAGRAGARPPARLLRARAAPAGHEAIGDAALGQIVGRQFDTAPRRRPARGCGSCASCRRCGRAFRDRFRARPGTSRWAAVRPPCRAFRGVLLSPYSTSFQLRCCSCWAARHSRQGAKGKPRPLRRCTDGIAISCDTLLPDRGLPASAALHQIGASGGML